MISLRYSFPDLRRGDNLGIDVKYLFETFMKPVNTNVCGHTHTDIYNMMWIYDFTAFLQSGNTVLYLSPSVQFLIQLTVFNRFRQHLDLQILGLPSGGSLGLSKPFCEISMSIFGFFFYKSDFWILLRKAENHKAEFAKGRILMAEISNGRNFQRPKNSLSQKLVRMDLRSRCARSVPS